MPIACTNAVQSLLLEGRIAIVTGGGRGIGTAIARALAGAGADVVIGDLDLEAASRVAASIRANGQAAEAVRADVGEAAGAEALVARAVERFGRVDILVNNAGIGLIKPFTETTPADLERVMRVNVTGPMLCAQAALRVMLPRSYGRIVNIVSISGSIGSQGRVAYGASKAALALMTKVMALELGGAGITVNAIAPGPIETEMSAALHSERTRRGYIERTPAGRYGTPEDVAAACVFLASEGAGYVCGQVLTVDGGFAMAGLPLE